MSPTSYLWSRKERKTCDCEETSTGPLVLIDHYLVIIQGVGFRINRKNNEYKESPLLVIYKCLVDIMSVASGPEVDGVVKVRSL